MAVFRANLGVGANFPAKLHKLPPDREMVFANEAEFLAHHKRISLSQAEHDLGVRTPTQLLADELADKRLMVKGL